MASSVFFCGHTLPPQTRTITAATAAGSSIYRSSSNLVAVCSANARTNNSSSSSRRGLLASSVILLLASQQQHQQALADILETYKADTQAVIQKVKQTLSMEKTNPDKPQAVASLRRASNDWVARYRREKSISGKPSFSNMYSVLNVTTSVSGLRLLYLPSDSSASLKRSIVLRKPWSEADSGGYLGLLSFTFHLSMNKDYHNLTCSQSWPV